MGTQTDNGVRVKCSEIEGVALLEIWIDGRLALIREDTDAIDTEHLQQRAEFLQHSLEPFSQDAILEMLWPAFQGV